MIIEEIEGVLDLTEEEKEEFQDNYFEYEDDIMELIELYREYNENIRNKSSLHSKLARYNYDIYETWMELHKNAISLSSYRAEVNLRGISLEPEFLQKLDDVIEKYVMIEKFL